MSTSQSSPSDHVNGHVSAFHKLNASTTPHSQQPSTPQPTSTMKPKSSSIPIASLISPPEATPLESFGHGPQSPATKPIARSAQHPPSPPVSPWTHASNQVTTSTAGRYVADPILFPEGSTAEGSNGEAQPLFPSPNLGSVIDAHIAARNNHPLPQNVEPPTRAEYAVMGPFIPIPTPQWETFTHLQTKEDWAAYHRKQYAEAKEDDRRRKEYRESQQFIDDERRKAATPWKRPDGCKHKPSNNGPLRPISSAGPSNLSNAMLDSATGPRSPKKIAKSSSSRPGRLSAAPARHDFTPRMESSLQAKKMAKKSSSKSSKPQVSDTKFDHIPNYCPPITSLDSKQMKISFEKTPREFTEADNKLLHLLHPKEQELARQEQLSAASYLATKRRIFVDRLYFYHFEKEQRAEQERLGKKEKPFVKNFLKTHAQEASKIDVNKTSRLHTAFDSVGWFDDNWFKDYPKPTFDNKQDKHFTPEDMKISLPGPQKHFKKPKGVNGVN